jgi:hypothetical protein
MCEAPRTRCLKTSNTGTLPKGGDEDKRAFLPSNEDQGAHAPLWGLSAIRRDFCSKLD